MMRTPIAAFAALFTLAGCGAGDEPPTRDDIKGAMSPMYNAPIDSIQNLVCTKRGPSKYQCDFTLSVIGLFPEQRSDCLFASTSGWMAVDSARCRN